MSCVNKPVSSNILADSQMSALGSVQLESMKGGMCTYYLEERKCSFNSVTQKEECTPELDVQQLVSAAPRTSASVATVIVCNFVIVAVAHILWPC